MLGSLIKDDRPIWEGMGQLNIFVNRHLLRYITYSPVLDLDKGQNKRRGLENDRILKTGGCLNNQGGGDFVVTRTDKKSENYEKEHCFCPFTTN